MKKLLAVALFAVCAFAQGVAGKWQESMDTPHGLMKGSIDFQQDGSKITGTMDIGPMGSFALKGTLEGEKVTFQIELPDNAGTLTFTGNVEGEKMSGTTSPHDIAWTATK